jgi:hypothetical protein
LTGWPRRWLRQMMTGGAAVSGRVYREHEC